MYKNWGNIYQFYKLSVILNIFEIFILLLEEMIVRIIQTHYILNSYELAKINTAIKYEIIYFNFYFLLVLTVTNTEEYFSTIRI